VIATCYWHNAGITHVQAAGFAGAVTRRVDANARTAGSRHAPALWMAGLARIGTATHNTLGSANRIIAPG